MDQEVMTEVSTRAMLTLVRASQCHAAMQGRTYVIPDDVKQLAPCVLAHRLMTYGSELKVKENGKLQIVGKDYLVKDGDILFIRSGAIKK